MIQQAFPFAGKRGRNSPCVACERCEEDLKRVRLGWLAEFGTADLFIFGNQARWGPWVTCTFQATR